MCGIVGRRSIILNLKKENVMSVKNLFTCLVVCFGVTTPVFANGLPCQKMLDGGELKAPSVAIGKPVDHVLVDLYQSCQVDFEKKWGTPYHFISQVSDLNKFKPSDIVTDKTRFVLTKTKTTKAIPTLSPVEEWLILKDVDNKYGTLTGS